MRKIIQLINKTAGAAAILAFVASGVLMTGDVFARGGFGGGYRGANFGSGMGNRGMGNVRYSGNNMGDMSGYKGYQGDNAGSRQSFDNSGFSQNRDDFGGDQNSFTGIRTART
jgi:hypothetical protein